jgi:hypothetical protein
MFESHIAVQEVLNHISRASCIFFHSLSSHFILSKIKIFASIAIQTDRTSQAIEARVRTIQKIFTTAKTKIAYITKAKNAINQEAL